MESQSKSIKKRNLIYWLSPIIVAVFQPIIYYILMMVLEHIDATSEVLHVCYYQKDAEMARYVFMITGFCTFPVFFCTAIPNYIYLYFLSHYERKRNSIICYYILFWVSIFIYINIVSIGIYIHYIRIATIYMLFFFIPFLLFSSRYKKAEIR